MKEQLLDANQVAEIFGLKPDTVRKLAWQRKIKSYKFGGALRFKLSDLEGQIIERPTAKEESS